MKKETPLIFAHFHNEKKQILNDLQFLQEGYLEEFLQVLKLKVNDGYFIDSDSLSTGIKEESDSAEVEYLEVTLKSFYLLVPCSFAYCTIYCKDLSDVNEDQINAIFARRHEFEHLIKGLGITVIENTYNTDSDWQYSYDEEGCRD